VSGVQGEARRVLVTGFPGPVASHVALLEADRGEVALLVRPGLRKAGEAFAASCGPRLTMLEGDPARVDMGLSGEEALAVRSSLRVIYHLEELGPEVEDRHALRAAREVVELASDARPRVVALSPLVPTRRGPGRSPTMDRVLRGRGSRLDPVIVEVGVTPGHGSLVHLVVLLHLGMDIRRLRSVASRRLVLTSPPLAARVAVHAGAGDVDGVVDLRDPRPPRLAQVDRALGGLLEGMQDVDAEFLSSCRRHRDRLIRRWIGGRDPVEELASWTVTEPRGGSGERVARDLGLAWASTLDVLESGLADVVADTRTALSEVAEERDALLG
jgi:hypothetical protein